MKIMIIEDDLTLAQELGKALEKWQLQTTITEDFEKVLEHFKATDPQLILMDVNLPYYNGYYWCTEIRKISQVPIIFISSVSDRMDMIMAMQMGADDYVAKPIDIPLMISKIQALLRRSYDFSVQSDILQFHQVQLNTSKSEIYYQDQSTQLTYTELQILIALFQKGNQYTAREAILDFCWQNDQFIDDNTLAVNMTRIRKKLRKIGLNRLIETKKNYGYRLQAEEEGE